MVHAVTTLPSALVPLVQHLERERRMLVLPVVKPSPLRKVMQVIGPNVWRGRSIGPKQMGYPLPRMSH
jgi:hypothetical protein